MIECVSIATCHHFPGNVLAEQHALRYREVIEKEHWAGIYVVDEMEFDRYDNLATEYLVARGRDGRVIGVARSYPTTIPYMLSEVFPYLSAQRLPESASVLEASRLVLDRSLLDKRERRSVVNRLVAAYVQRGLQRGIDGYVGFMLPKIWESTFLRAGWDVEWLGPEMPLPRSRDVVRAAFMPVNDDVASQVAMATGIDRSVLSFGDGADGAASTAVYSHQIVESIREAAA